MPGFVVYDEVKRGNINAAPQAPLQGDEEAPAGGPGFFAMTH